MTESELMTPEAMRLWIHSLKSDFDHCAEQLWKIRPHLKAIRFCSNCGNETIIDDHGNCMICGGGYSITLFGPPLPRGIDVKALYREVRKPSKVKKVILTDLESDR